MQENLTGSLLVAHPTLRDPNFRRTILFLSHHSEDEGATGVILNRPLEEYLPDQPGTGRVPIYFGGPVEPSRILLASLQWRENPAAVAFRTFPGRLSDASIELQWQQGLRAFAGYAGWSSGQLEGEIAEQSWIVVPPTRALVSMENETGAWKELMRSLGPVTHLLSEIPDDPSLN